MTESPFVDSGFVVPVFSPRDDLIACLNKAMAFLTVVASSRVIVQQVQGRQGQSYSSTGYKSNAISSGGNNPRGQARVVKCYNCQGEGHIARQCTQPKQPRNAAWYKVKAMLAEAQEAGQVLDEEQLAFLADLGVLDGQAVQTIILNNVAFQTEDLDTYDSDCDDISNAKAVLLANICNYGSDVISEKNVQDTHMQAQQDLMILSVIEQMSEQMINHVNNWEKANKEKSNESVTTELERYKERVKIFEQRLNIDLSSHEKMIDSQMDDMIKEKIALKEQVDSLEQNISKKSKKRNVYYKHSLLSDDFGKRFTLQQELSAEQAFWLRMSNPTSKPSDASPVKIEAPKELPKVSLVNESIKKIKFHLVRFDNVVKIRTTPDARTYGEWGFKHTKAIFNNEIIPFLKSLKDIFNLFDRDLLNEIMEVQTVFGQMDVVVQQSSVDKQCLEISKIELLLENDRLLQQIMSQDVLLTVTNSISLIGEFVNMDGKRKESYASCNSQNPFKILGFFENNDLKAQLEDKDNTICKLKDIIKYMREKSKEENGNYDYGEIETKNVELKNSVAKLISENEHLCNEINHVKHVLKEQFDLIKKICVRTNEHSDSLIDKLNLKSTENEDLKAQIQDKAFVITSLKNNLRKVKGKEIVDIATQIPSANIIVQGMFKLDLEALASRLLQNREAHIDYLEYTQE
ncbi:integrase, catalytic region, zinc finger, CCHC-type containing protein [Tanacetum coccineum]